MPIGEDDLYDAAYFLGDFLLDRFCRFFSCTVKVSSTGRNLQMLWQAEGARHVYAKIDSTPMTFDELQRAYQPLRDQALAVRRYL